jgi:integrase
MAQGSIIWRCRECGNCSSACKHKGGRYAIAYPVQKWDPEKGRVVKRQKWETVGPRKKEAEARLAAQLKSQHDGTYRELQDITFADFADKWMQEYVQGAVKRSTWQAYDSHIRVHFKPALGALALRAIHEDTIQGYIAGKLAAGAKPKSVKNHLVILKHMLKHAVKWGYLATNPAADVKAPRVERQEMDILTPEQVCHLLTAQGEDGGPAIRPGWYVPIKLAIFSGLRQGEQFALQVGDLDFHAGQVRVRRTLSWDWKRHAAGASRCRITSPKTKSAIRNVDLPPDLLEDLQRYKAGLPDQDPDRLLFATSAGTPLDPKNVVDRVFRVALTRAKLARIRWHDLRHTYASLQLAAGANIKYLSQQMGHASVQITLDRYSHLLRDSHPAQAARLSALVFEGAPVAPPTDDEHAAGRANEKPTENQKSTKGSARANVVLKESPPIPQNTVKDGERSKAPIPA